MFNWIIKKILGSKNQRTVRKLQPVVAEINRIEEQLQQQDEQALRDRVAKWQQQFRAFHTPPFLGGVALRIADEQQVNAALEGIAPYLDALKAHFPSLDAEEVKTSAWASASLDDKKARIDRARDAWNAIQPKFADIEQQMLNDILPEAYAVVKNAARRLSGSDITVCDTPLKWNMVHFDVQLIGGIALHRGMIAEMATGEGKTLVGTLPVFLNALTGRGVHVITVNDYLARRDSEWMGHLYKFLGLTVGVIQNDQPSHIRAEQYRCDITYGTNNEFGFDYLRDNMKESIERYVQRDLHFAIVDEVDSILIDEARTPLIIAGPAEQSAQLYYKVNQIIPRLKKDIDFTVDEKHHSAVLTDSGVEKVEKLLSIHNLYDAQNIEWNHHVQQALKAHSLYKKDVNYMVSDEGKVVIIDEFTGRLMPGRRWSDGLHQAIEAKENVQIEEETQTLATISFQNLFRLYKKLAGMTGTADTEAEEFHKIYKLDCVIIPTNLSMVRKDHPDLVYKNERGKFRAVIEEVAECYERGQPVLVGTVSIASPVFTARPFLSTYISCA